MLEKLEGRRLLSATVTSIDLDVDADGSATPAGYRHRFAAVFSEDVSASIDANDALVENLTFGWTADRSGTDWSLDYNPTSNTLYVQTDERHELGEEYLPDGYYEVTLLGDGLPAGESAPAGGLYGSDGVGIGAGDVSAGGMYFLNGDFNRDRVVNLADYGVLQANFGTGTTFQEGDANGDGAVDLTDFGILQSQWGKTIAAPPSTVADISISVTGHDQLTLGWMLPTSGSYDGFRVYRSTEAGALDLELVAELRDGNYNVAGGVATWTDTSLKDATRYFYKIRPFTDAGGNGEATHRRYATTAAAGLRDVFTVKDGTDYKIGWTPTGRHQSGFDIEASGDGGATWTVLNGGVSLSADTRRYVVADTATELPTLSGASTHLFRVEAIYTSGGTSPTDAIVADDVIAFETLLSPTPIASEPDGLIGTTAGAGGDYAPGAGIAPEAPVRYADGALVLSHRDLSSEGFGAGFGHTRSWTNFADRLGVDDAWDGAFGNGWVVEQLPYVDRLAGEETVQIVSSGTSARQFLRDQDLLPHQQAGGIIDYEPRFFGEGVETLRLNEDEGLDKDEYTLTDAAGQVVKFHGFSSGVPAKQQGKLKSLEDAGGNRTVAHYHIDGRLDYVERGGSGANGSTKSERYTYGWNTGNTRVTSVELARASSGYTDFATDLDHEIIRIARYDYYGANDAHGTEGDLKYAEVFEPDGSTGEVSIDKSYYRYYDGTVGVTDGLLKMAFKPTHFERLKADSASFATDSDEDVAPFAAMDLMYDGGARVTEVDLQDAGQSGTFEYGYDAATSDRSDARGEWHQQTSELLPDGERRVVYTNSFKQPILTVQQDWDQENEVVEGNEWSTFRAYDAHGRLILQANPSAVLAYDEAEPNLLGGDFADLDDLRDTSGLVTTYRYADRSIATSSAAGDAWGFLHSWYLRRGEQGAYAPQETFLYADRLGYHPVASQSRFTGENWSGRETTSYDYFDTDAWHTGTRQPANVETTLPIVTIDRNGPGTATTLETYYDLQGRPTWMRDGEGFLSRTSYDVATSAVTGMIQDVDTGTVHRRADRLEFAESDPPPPRISLRGRRGRPRHQARRTHPAARTTRSTTTRTSSPGSTRRGATGPAESRCCPSRRRPSIAAPGCGRRCKYLYPTTGTDAGHSQRQRDGRRRRLHLRAPAVRQPCRPHDRCRWLCRRKWWRRTRNQRRLRRRNADRRASAERRCGLHQLRLRRPGSRHLSRRPRHDDHAVGARSARPPCERVGRNRGLRCLARRSVSATRRIDLASGRHSV